MKKRINVVLIILIMMIVTVKALPGEDYTPTYNAKETLEEKGQFESKSYSSTGSSENALLVKSELFLNNIKIVKTGDGSNENDDFYGTNAALLAINEAKVKMDKSNISTNGKYANAVFSYGTATIDINNSKISTSGDNSGGIMVAGGGKLNANNDIVVTKGNSSAAIRSDRGGGNISIEGGKYSTSGSGSPAIYSTANISVSSATLTSTASEGIIVEGANSVDITNTTLTDNNTSLHGDSETYKNIFLYQSMSGDSEEGTASFESKNSTITTNKGDTIFVTNTSCIITLNGNKIINNDPSGVLLRVQAGKWGTSGSNGGKVKLNIESQELEGDIVADKISSVDIFISSNSNYKGTINKDNTGIINLQISSESDMTLQGDSYVKKLVNGDKTNNNIHANGHKLFVDGKEVKINGSKNSNLPTTPTTNEKADYTQFYYIGGGVMAFLLFLIIIILVSRKRREKKELEKAKEVQLPMMDATPKSVNEIYKNIRK